MLALLKELTRRAPMLYRFSCNMPTKSPSIPVPDSKDITMPIFKVELDIDATFATVVHADSEDEALAVGREALTRMDGNFDSNDDGFEDGTVTELSYDDLPGDAFMSPELRMQWARTGRDPRM